VKRIAAEFADGTSIEASRAGDYWLLWSRKPGEAVRIVAYDASGVEVWSDRPA
jgi:hypothetical protein